jgi:hypothetical protein
MSANPQPPSPPTPPPPTPPADEVPLKVVVISHSPLFYWWPVWVVGFIMAALTFFYGEQVAFVPTDTVAEKQRKVEGHEGPRDVLITPAERGLPTLTDESDELKQPRLRMATSNNMGVIWAVTLCLVILITHFQLRGIWSIFVITLVVLVTLLLAIFGAWDPILGVVQLIDIHINGFGYFSISLFLFVIWLITFLFYDRLNYMVFTRGQLRVRMTIGAGELVFDTRGMLIDRHRDDLLRHWVLGFGAGDITVRTAGTNARTFEMPNVLFIGHKLTLINTMLQEREVIQAR